jgi:hypothetical protein
LTHETPVHVVALGVVLGGGGLGGRSSGLGGLGGRLVGGGLGGPGGGMITNQAIVPEQGCSVEKQFSTTL